MSFDCCVQPIKFHPFPGALHCWKMSEWNWKWKEENLTLSGAEACERLSKDFHDGEQNLIEIKRRIN